MNKRRRYKAKRTRRLGGVRGWNRASNRRLNLFFKRIDWEESAQKNWTWSKHEMNPGQ